MMTFLRGLSEYEYINYVILVCNSSNRFDAQTQITVAYYMSIFSDIIRPDNLHLICTHYSTDDFEEDVQSPEKFEAQVQEIKEIFTKEFQFELINVDYVNLNPKKIQKPSKNDVYAHSRHVRKSSYQILLLIPYLTDIYDALS